MERNWSIIIVMCIAVLLLFLTMVFSAMASTDANKSCSDTKEGCHKWATISSLLSGLAFLVSVLYLTRKQICSIL